LLHGRYAFSILRTAGVNSFFWVFVKADIVTNTPICGLPRYAWYSSKLIHVVNGYEWQTLRAEALEGGQVNWLPPSRSEEEVLEGMLAKLAEERCYDNPHMNPDTVRPLHSFC
jgi:hypothetical protein